MKKVRIHVVSSRGKWAVLRGAHTLKRYDSQGEAVEKANTYLSDGADVFIHDANGMVVEWKTGK